ncbi:MAG: bifunctional diaminohydroxyphosphoribosylaminopyrimidine deaminase/5-amino-6-(5-phosphoribosylamino)uracil reductase RibD [Pseudomonadota bacterium]
MGDARSTSSIEPQKEVHAMQRACTLAQRAAGRTAPNPMVGCVIMRADGAIVGNGWHEGPGEDHAEIMALKEAGDAAKGATVFVTLEPCNHTGRTGPCAEALIAANVREVVYAIADPNPIAAGGAARLREAGIVVRSGLCEVEARHANRAWLHALKARRPYIIGKTAMSLDGRIATRFGESQWITSEASRLQGHWLRRNADAILAGAQTVIDDDPALTARLETGVQYPLRVVVDSTARTSAGAKVYERSGKGALLATTRRAPYERLAAFKEMGVETLTLPTDDNARTDLLALTDALFERDIHTLMVEGGGETLGAFFDRDLIDELHLFIAPKLIGGGKPAFNGEGVSALADASRFNFSQMKHDGPDQYWLGQRKERN